MTRPGMRLLARLIVSSTLMMICFPSPAPGENDDPFRIPKKDFLASVVNIALWPIELPPGTADAAAVRAELEQILIAELQRHGFAVLSSKHLGRRWEELSTSVGGIVDPITGESDELQVRLLRGLLTQEFALERGVDAFLRLRLTEGTMRVWEKDIASRDSGGRGAYTVWMAANEETTWHGEPIVALWINRPQQVVGPRLGIRILDAIDMPLYDIMIPIRWSRIYLHGAHEDRPETRLLEHRERIEEVMASLLEGLAETEEVPDASD